MVSRAQVVLLSKGAITGSYHIFRLLEPREMEALLHREG